VGLQQPLARDVMTAEVVSVAPDTTLRSVCALMREHDIGAVPVIDAVSHVQRGPGVPFREEIPHRAIERPRQPHLDALGRDERKRSAHFAHSRRIARQPAARLVERHVVDAVERRIREIDDATDGVVHPWIVVYC